MTKSLREWLAEGEQIYNDSMREYQALLTQIDELEQRIAAKKAEVNEIARVTGKPPVEGRVRAVAEILDAEQVQSLHAIPPGRMAQALGGRGSAVR
jgi:uncharacterized small protein (DUF1192 family)